MGSGKKSTSTAKVTGGKSIGDRLIPAVEKPFIRVQKSENELIECKPILFPIVKQTDVSQDLPRYTTVLSRSVEDGVGMEDLDQLQQDFEKLLSKCALRQRVLRSEIESIDRVDNGRDKKSDKPPSPAVKRTIPIKRKRFKEKTKSTKDSKSSFKRSGKSKHSLSAGSSNDSPKMLIPKNDFSDRFWLSIEPYCTDITKENICFLEDLLRECSQDIDIRIPEIGEHYAYEWSETSLQTEQTTINGKNIKKPNVHNHIKKNGVNNAILETLQNPLAQRLLDTLIEHKVMNLPTTYNRLHASDFGFKSLNGSRNGACFDEILRKELVQEGILEIEDLHKPFPPDDEILTEIKKCQQELSIINRQNITDLNKLRNIIENDVRRQEVKTALEKVDKQIIKMYTKITPDVSSVIEEQGVLHRELLELSDLSYLE